MNEIAALLEQAQAGDMQAFGLLCRTLEPRLRRQATLKISSLSDAAVAENLVRSDRSRRGSPAGPKRRNRRGADHSVRPVAGFNWGWVIPAFALVAFSLLVVSVLLRTPVNSQPFAARNQVAEKISASHELLPTLANYQAVANHSFDELDELLSRQAQKNVAAPPAPSAGTLALLHLPD